VVIFKSLLLVHLKNSVFFLPGSEGMRVEGRGRGKGRGGRKGRGWGKGGRNDPNIVHTYE
jgi:hypothetical protein